MNDDEYPFHWFQCVMCGKMFDSQDAQEEHERKCRKNIIAIRITDRSSEDSAKERREVASNNNAR